MYQQATLSNQMVVDEFFYQKEDVVSPHASLWGDFNFSLNGTLEFEIEGHAYLSPPSYGLWIPPHTQHQSRPIQHDIHYICIRLHPELSQFFPDQCVTLSIQPFFRAVVEQILILQKQPEQPPQYLEHLLWVLFDQLQQAPTYSHYLPQSTHPQLVQVLEKMASPELFRQSLQQLLALFPLSERHLLRLSQQELHLSLSEWRNRAKIIYAIQQLRQGSTIKQLAYTLGYNHSSSFIEFFKRYTGQTPIQLKNATL